MGGQPRKRKKKSKSKSGWLAAFGSAEPTLGCIRSDIDHSTPMQIHPRMAWIYVSTKVDTYQQQRELVEGGALWVCGV